MLCFWWILRRVCFNRLIWSFTPSLITAVRWAGLRWPRPTASQKRDVTAGTTIYGQPALLIWTLTSNLIFLPRTWSLGVIPYFHSEWRKRHNNPNLKQQPSEERLRPEFLNMVRMNLRSEPRLGLIWSRQNFRLRLYLWSRGFRFPSRSRFCQCKDDTDLWEAVGGFSVNVTQLWWTKTFEGLSFFFFF